MKQGNTRVLPVPTLSLTAISQMWRSGGDIGNGFGGAYSEAHQWFGKNNLSTAHPWGLAPISRPGCWGASVAVVVAILVDDLDNSIWWGKNGSPV